MNDINLGLQLMVIGVAGVFVVLILFYLMIKIMMRLIPYKSEEE